MLTYRELPIGMLTCYSALCCMNTVLLVRRIPHALWLGLHFVLRQRRPHQREAHSPGTPSACLCAISKCPTPSSSVASPCGVVIAIAVYCSVLCLQLSVLYGAGPRPTPTPQPTPPVSPPATIIASEASTVTLTCDGGGCRTLVRRLKSSSACTHMHAHQLCHFPD